VSSTPRTKEDIIKRVLRRLGAPTLKIELTKDQTADAYNDAVMWYVGRKGMKKTLTVQVIAGQQDYGNFPKDVDDVVGVTPPRSGAWDLSPWEAEAAFLGMRGFPVGEGNPLSSGASPSYSALVQNAQYGEQARKVLGRNFSWDWDQEHRVVRIYPKPSDGGQMIISYLSNELDLGTLSVRMVNLVLRRTVAEAKEVLGRVRSKYPEWMMAGGERAMDGDTLLMESQTEKDELDEEIDNLSYPIPFLLQ